MSLAGLIDVIHWLEDVFNRLQLQRSYGGAVAYNYYGPPRLTQDVDVLAVIPDTKVPEFVEELSRAACRQLGAGGLRPVELSAVLQDLRSKAHLAVFLCKGIRMELFLAWHPFHHAVLQRSPLRDLEGRRIPIHAAEDLVVFKKIFDRPKDIGDIKAILMTQKGKLHLDRLRSDASQLLTEDSFQELETLLSQFG
jgi:hypothetical protein